IALAEIEPDVVPQHQEEALVRGAVEAELLLQACDEFRIEPLRAAVFGRNTGDLAAAGLSARAEIAALPAGQAGFCAGRGPGQDRNDALDRAAGRELHHDERD